jgi:hypothetical protein
MFSISSLSLNLLNIHSALEILTTTFWLTTFALLAQESQAWDAAQSILDEVNGLGAYEGVHIAVWSKAESAIKASKAATAFAALNWVLFLVTLFVFGTYPDSSECSPFRFHVTLQGIQ